MNRLYAIMLKQPGFLRKRTFAFFAGRWHNRRLLIDNNNIDGLFDIRTADGANGNYFLI